MSETTLTATLGNAFNKTDNAFAVHDVSKFESTLQQTGVSIHSNPFNDSVSAFSEISPNRNIYSTTPKKDLDYLNNNNISAIFSSYSTASNLNEFKNGSSTSKLDSTNGTKNPFSATEKNNTWNELNMLDLNKLRFQMNNDNESQSSIFSSSPNPEQSVGKSEIKKEIPIDLFKDVAKAAFSEFNGTRHKNNEFFNKITGFDCVRT